MVKKTLVALLGAAALALGGLILIFSSVLLDSNTEPNITNTTYSNISNGITASFQANTNPTFNITTINPNFNLTTTTFKDNDMYDDDEEQVITETLPDDDSHKIEKTTIHADPKFSPENISNENIARNQLSVNPIIDLTTAEPKINLSTPLSQTTTRKDNGNAQKEKYNGNYGNEEDNDYDSYAFLDQTTHLSAAELFLSG